MKDYVVVLIAFMLVVLIVPNVYFETKRRKQAEYLAKKLQNFDFEGFYKTIEDKSKVKYIAPFNLEFMKLNAAIFQKKTHLIDAQVSTLEGMSLNNRQLSEVFSQLLNYYITIEDEKRATKYLDKLKTVATDGQYEQAEMFYDIQIRKGYKYLDTLLNTVDQMGNAVPAPLYYMIAKMYANKGDKESEQKYLDMAIGK